MADFAGIRIGTAGWSIPRQSAVRFNSAGSHLARYSRQLSCAEINSSFYRPHAVSTYAKWREATPEDFRFAVKMPRVITHELKLQRARQVFADFLTQSDGLGRKRGPILVQLPPSLSFDALVVADFFDGVRAVYEGPMVCEPRHPTWFAPAAASLLERYRVARVAADPPLPSAGLSPDGWPGLAYFRLHGSPAMYWSRYDDAFVATLSARLVSLAQAAEVWCIFDNTASGAAIENAWELRERCGCGLGETGTSQKERLMARTT
jgi:uncharacterized protein YecE (DUF72 family)